MGLYDDAVEHASRQFVGRRTERARFKALLERRESRVWWVFGPGGIGKSRLLEVLTAQAQASGFRIATADLRSNESEVTSPSVATMVSGQLSEADPGPALVVLDGVETGGAFEEWLRGHLLADLPSPSVVVIGSRSAPSAEWRADLAWSALLETVPLRALSGEEGQQLLALAGVREELRPRAMQLTRGHPLALQLLAEALVHDSDRDVPDAIAGAPDLVAALLARFVDDVPDAHRRRAVEVAAIARVTTRGLLRDACPRSDAQALFDWLCERPWVERARDGVRPHDLARDVIEADLRTNDPDRHAAAKRAVRDHVLDPERMRRDPDRCARDYVHLHRHSPVLRSAWDWSARGGFDVTAPWPTDHDVLTDLVAAAYGPASVAVMEHWLAAQPQAFGVVRSHRAVVGFTTLLTVADASATDLRVDPSLAAVWRRARSRGRPREGEDVGLARFVCDREAGTLPPSPTYNVVTALSVRRWLTSPRLGLDYVVTPRGGAYRPMMDYVDFHAVEGATHHVGDVEMVVFEHDWRASSPARWLDRMEALEAGAPVVPVADDGPVIVALDEHAFADAVRTALRDLTRPKRLAGNPLLASRVVRDHPGAGGPDALVAALRAAFEALDDHPRTDRARRAVARTYLHGAVTQEAAAEVLGMAFSTYRRHLAAGVDLLVDRLWRWELYGRDG